MKGLIDFLTSSIGRKLTLSLTGLFLCIFLLGHLLGNLQLLLPDNGEAFNEYAEMMATSPLVYVLEVITFSAFLIHIFQGILISIKNRAARGGNSYHVSKAGENSSTFARNMIYSGSLVLVFMVIHLKGFFSHKVMYWLYLESKPDMYRLVAEAFSDPVYVAIYVVAMLVLAFHLNHAFQSAFQTLGLNHRKYTPFIKKLGIGFSILIPMGFAIIPLFFLFDLKNYL